MAKQPKSAVGYSLGGDHCGACIHFIDENEKTETGRCELVEGDIGEDMWCRLFSRIPMSPSVGRYARHVRKGGMIGA